MHERLERVSTAETWGPVRRGFSVGFPDGERGRLEEIRVRGDTAELLVEASRSGRLVAVDGANVAAILPRRRHILLSSMLERHDRTGVETAGGIVRMPARHSSRLAGSPGES